jgi:hypothetical protein
MPETCVRLLEKEMWREFVRAKNVWIKIGAGFPCRKLLSDFAARPERAAEY